MTLKGYNYPEVACRGEGARIHHEGANLTSISDDKCQKCWKNVDRNNNLAICCDKSQEWLHGSCANIDAADLTVLAKYGSVQRICKNCVSQPCNAIQQDQFKLLIEKRDALVDQWNWDNAKLLEMQNQIKDMTATIQAFQPQIDTKPTFAEKTKDNAAVPAQAATKTGLFNKPVSRHLSKILIVSKTNSCENSVVIK